MAAPDVRTPGASRANAEDTREDTAQFTGQPTDLQTDKPTAIAKALLAGIAVHELPDDGFVLMQRGLVVPLRGLSGVLALLRAMGGAL